MPRLARSTRGWLAEFGTLGRDRDVRGGGAAHMIHPVSIQPTVSQVRSPFALATTRPVIEPT